MDALDLIFEASSEQRTPQWFNQRRGRFTSSTYGALMTGYKKPIKDSATAMAVVIKNAVEIVTGDVNTFSSEATDHGTINEAEAVIRYMEQTGNVVTECGFIPKGKFGGSPDGLVGLDGLIEVKCPFNLENHVKVMTLEEVPKQYVYQVQGNLWITGRDWCDFISFAPTFPEVSQLKILRVFPDKEQIESLVIRLEEAEEEKNRIVKLIMGQK